MAIDLPGFGHSQRREELLSPRAMAEFVIRAADAFALDHPHLVGPGTGTAAALFAAAAYPDRLRSLVVGSGAAEVRSSWAGGSGTGSRLPAWRSSAVRTRGSPPGITDPMSSAQPTARPEYSSVYRGGSGLCG